MILDNCFFFFRLKFFLCVNINKKIKDKKKKEDCLKNHEVLFTESRIVYVSYKDTFMNSSPEI